MVAFFSLTQACMVFIPLIESLVKFVVVTEEWEPDLEQDKHS